MVRKALDQPNIKIFERRSEYHKESIWRMINQKNLVLKRFEYIQDNLIIVLLTIVHIEIVFMKKFRRLFE